MVAAGYVLLYWIDRPFVQSAVLHVLPPQDMCNNKQAGRTWLGQLSKRGEARVCQGQGSSCNARDGRSLLQTELVKPLVISRVPAVFGMNDE